MRDASEVDVLMRAVAELHRETVRSDHFETGDAVDGVWHYLSGSICQLVESGFDRCQSVHMTGEARSPLDVTRPKRLAYVVQLVRVLDRQVRCPATISFHQRDVHLGRKVALSHESFARLGVHFRLLRHVSSHFVGSGIDRMSRGP